MKIKKKLRKIKHFFLGLLKREITLVFYSHSTALAKATQENLSKQDNQNELTIAETLINDALICKEIIAIPLDEGKEKAYSQVYSGGLVDSMHLQLIEEAVQRKDNNPCQELSYFGSYAQLQQQRKEPGLGENFGKQIPRVKKFVFFGGMLYNHFGHFLVESLGRLWAYEAFRQFDPYIFFYAPVGIPDYLERNNFVNQVLSGFKIPHKKLIFSNHLIRFERIIIPCQKYGFGYMLDPDPAFLDFVRKFQFKHVYPTGFENADKLYVSRSKSGCRGKIVGESLFEEYLISEGYKIFYPEKFNLFEQLTVYENAKKIIFCEGSASHGCILLPDLQADVAIILRRIKRINSHRRAVVDQFRGYGKDVLLINALKGQYEFGIESTSALSKVDWYQASILLQMRDFVTKPFYQFNEVNYTDLVKCDLEKYVKQISSDSRFIDFMISLKE